MHHIGQLDPALHWSCEEWRHDGYTRSVGTCVPPDEPCDAREPILDDNSAARGKRGLIWSHGTRERGHGEVGVQRGSTSWTASNLSSCFADGRRELTTSMESSRRLSIIQRLHPHPPTRVLKTPLQKILASHVVSLQPMSENGEARDDS